MKVLIADDDATSRQLLASVMERWGFMPELAEDGLQALEVMSREDGTGHPDAGLGNARS